VVSKGASIFLIREPGVSVEGNALESFGPGGLRLPVAPLSDVNINENIVVNDDTLPRLGSVVFGGGQGATSIQVATEFPLEQNSYVQFAGIGSPSDYNNIIKRLAKDNTIFRLLIAHSENTNRLHDDFLIFDDVVMIQSFSRVHGDGLDIGVNLDFVKWQPVTIRKYEQRGYNGPWKDRKKGDSGRSGAKPRPPWEKLSKTNTLDKVATKYYDSAKAWRWILSHKHNRKYSKAGGPRAGILKNAKIYLPNIWENEAKFYSTTGFKR